MKDLVRQSAAFLCDVKELTDLWPDLQTSLFPFLPRMIFWRGGGMKSMT